MRKPLAFQKAASLLPSGSTGGMLILFQLDRRHPEFPAQVSGADGNYSLGRSESPAKDFRNKLPLENCTPSAVSPFGNIVSIFLFPARLVFLKFVIEVQWSVSTGVAQIGSGASVYGTESRSVRPYYFSIILTFLLPDNGLKGDLL